MRPTLGPVGHPLPCGSSLTLWVIPYPVGQGRPQLRNSTYIKFERNRYPKEAPGKGFFEAEKNLKNILACNPTKLNRLNATLGKSANSFLVGNVSFFA